MRLASTISHARYGASIYFLPETGRWFVSFRGNLQGRKTREVAERSEADVWVEALIAAERASLDARAFCGEETYG